MGLALQRVNLVNVLAHIVKVVQGDTYAHSESKKLSQATSLTEFAMNVSRRVAIIRLLTAQNTVMDTCVKFMVERYK